MTSPLYEEDSHVRPDGLMQYSRQDFCENVFQYGPGEHVVFGGASTNGKTSLAFDMLEYIVTPKFPAYVAVSKPRDPVTLKRGNELGFRTVPDWPPQKQLKEYEIFGGKKPNGYLIWSAFGDLNTDMPRAAAVTRKLIMERYANGVHGKDSGGILVMDDTMVKAKIMGLDNEMVTILAMAGAMDIGLWVFVQKPTDSGRTTTWSYEQAKHLLLTRGGDARMLDRYSEIIGTNGKYAKAVIPTLKPFQFVYINKTDDTMCIVGAK